MLLVAAAVGGIVIVFCGYVGYRLVSSTYCRLVSSTYYRLVRIYKNILSSDCFIVLRSADTSSKSRIPRITLEWTKKSNVATVTKNPPFLRFYMNFL